MYSAALLVAYSVVTPMFLLAHWVHSYRDLGGRWNSLI